MLPAPAPVVVIHGDPGGRVDLFARRVARYDRVVVRVEVRGECASSCTMVLALADRVCVGPRASFGFRQAYVPLPRQPFATWNRSEAGTAVLMAHYPPAVVTWIESHGGLTRDLIWLRGDELRDMLPACRGGETAPVKQPVPGFVETSEPAVRRHK